MAKILSIARQELKMYFKSPIAYIVLMIGISIFNIFFFMIINENREATLRDVFAVMEFMFVFFIPLITMKCFSEEKASGTMEFLMTTPTTNTAIVLGKYIGTVLFFSILMAFTLIYYAIIDFYGEPDRLAILTGYLGVWLEGIFFIAIGLMVSAWTRSQIIAAISSYLILFLLFFATVFTQYTSGNLEVWISYVSTLSHAKNFSAGIIGVADVTYYLTGILFCIIVTRISIENRLWR